MERSSVYVKLYVEHNLHIEQGLFFHMDRWQLPFGLAIHALTSLVAVRVYKLLESWQGRSSARSICRLRKDNGYESNRFHMMKSS